MPGSEVRGRARKRGQGQRLRSGAELEEWGRAGEPTPKKTHPVGSKCLGQQILRLSAREAGS